MSRSAGRVLIIPRGEYSATTQYYMLDLVEYNGCGYVAKQATKGNLPTNDTYWQQMGTTGGGGGDPSTYMLIDGSNAEILKFAESQPYTIQHVDISKNEGANQTVRMTVHVPYNSTTGKLTDLTIAELNAHVGDQNISFSTVINEVSVTLYVIIDSVGGASKSYDTDDDTISVTGHLKNDVTSALSLTDKTLGLAEYIKSGVERGIMFGYAQTLSNNLSFAGGRQSTAGLNSEAYGDRCAAGSYAHAEGQNTCATLKSHAEGRYTVADGEGTHAEGTGTIAAYTNQHAQGKWNMPRYGAAFMIGNGTPSARSNCFEIYEDGSISFDNGTTTFKLAKVGGVFGFYDKNGTFYPFYPVTVATKQVTLSTSNTTETRISNSAITANSRLDWFIDKFGINPINVEAGVGYCDFTFAKADSATTINISLEIK